MENALSNPTGIILHSVVYIQFYGLVIFKELSLCFGICGLAAGTFAGVCFALLWGCCWICEKVWTLL